MTETQLSVSGVRRLEASCANAEGSHAEAWEPDNDPAFCSECRRGSTRSQRPRWERNDQTRSSGPGRHQLVDTELRWKLQTW